MANHEFSFTSHANPLLIAHRGGGAEASEHGLAENTIPAFARTVETMRDGSDVFTPAIETDVCQGITDSIRMVMNMRSMCPFKFVYFRLT